MTIVYVAERSNGDDYEPWSEIAAVFAHRDTAEQYARTQYGDVEIIAFNVAGSLEDQALIDRRNRLADDVAVLVRPKRSRKPDQLEVINDELKRRGYV